MKNSHTLTADPPRQCQRPPSARRPPATSVTPGRWPSSGVRRALIGREEASAAPVTPSMQRRSFASWCATAGAIPSPNPSPCAGCRWCRAQARWSRRRPAGVNHPARAWRRNRRRIGSAYSSRATDPGKRRRRGKRCCTNSRGGIRVYAEFDEGNAAIDQNPMSRLRLNA